MHGISDSHWQGKLTIFEHLKLTRTFDGMI